MTVYITQGKFTQSALKGLVAKPEDRVAEVRALAKRNGGKLLDYYVTFGEYDFLIIFEAPDATAAFAIVATAGAGGSVADTKTTVGLTTAEAKSGFELAQKGAERFRSAGT